MKLFKNILFFFSISNSLSWYLQKKFWKQFLSLLVICTFVYWLKDSLLILDLILNKHVPVWFVLNSSISIVPIIITIITPFVTVICTMSVMTSIILNKEYIVMRSAGMSNASIVKPFLISGLSLTVISYVLFLFVLPNSYLALFRLKNLSEKNLISPSLLSKQSFTNIDESSSIYVSNVSNDNILKNLVIFVSSKDSESIIIAPSGKFRYDKLTGFPYLVLEESKLTNFNYVLFSQSVIDFKQYVFPMVSKDYSSKISVRELSTAQLFVAKDSLKKVSEISKLKEISHALGNRERELLIRTLSPLQAFTLMLIALNLMLSLPFNRRISILPFIKIAIITAAYTQLANLSVKNADDIEYKKYVAITFHITILIIALLLVYKKQTLKQNKEWKLNRNLRLRCIVIYRRYFKKIINLSLKKINLVKYKV